MSVISRVVSRMLKLPPAETYDVGVDKDVQIPMPDGTILLASHYFPRHLSNRPTALVRSPYGRGSFWGLLFGRIVAEHGFHVLVQSCRGTSGSGGELNPFRHERADGLATVAWLRQQDWYNGELATFGPSYLGLVQWAIASEIGAELKAMSTWITSAEFRSVTYPGDALYLESALGWTTMMHHQEHNKFGVLGQLFQSKQPLQTAYQHMPLHEADKVATGEHIPHWQDWMVHEQPGDEWWLDTDFSADVPNISAPNHMFGGWYDLFLAQTLRDYQALKAAGHNPHLTIGPWAHVDTSLFPVALTATIHWLRGHLLHETQHLPAQPVHIFVMGADEWRDLDAFPPASTPQAWYLQGDSALAVMPSAAAAPDFYRYDPAHPTPNVGGAGMGAITGAQDNAAIEARDDVLVYSSAILEQDVEVIGAVTATLYVKSSLEHTDFFARLCDVDETGKSTNICDGLVRLFPGKFAADAEGIRCVVIDMAACAYRFKRGHRIRLQVASGAFPRWSRNTGSGEPLKTAAQLVVAEQHVYHDAAHPSAVTLPIVG